MCNAKAGIEEFDGLCGSCIEANVYRTHRAWCRFCGRSFILDHIMQCAGCAQVPEMDPRNPFEDLSGQP